jgi:hypothetical protein
MSQYIFIIILIVNELLLYHIIISLVLYMFALTTTK